MSRIKNLFEKACSLLMAACMVLGSGTAVAFAADTNASDTGSITVNFSEGITEQTKISVYRIAKAEYDSNGNFTGYAMTVTSSSDFKIDEYGGYTEGTLTEENLAKLFEDCGAAVKTVNASIGDTSVTIDGLAVGSYLVVVEGSESTVYGMMIGSIYYESNESGWAIEDGRIAVASSELWVKATTPSILKEETGGSLEDYGHGGSADVGDTLEYHITVSNIPSYYGDYPEFIVTDKISSELTITADELAALTVTVKGGTYDGKVLTKGTDYTVTETSDGFTVDFVVSGSYTLNDYAGQSLLIDFRADVTSSTGDADDHENDATLTYATTSYAQGSEGTDSDADHEYTFSVKAYKIDSDTNPLSGAEFALYTDAGCTSAYEQKGSAVTATSSGDGSITFSGLEEGTYYLKETKAPAGYAINEAVYTVTISAEYSGQTSKNGGELSSWSITIKDASGNILKSVEQTSDTGFRITNSKVGSLPSMGGMGTMMFTLAGAAIIFASLGGVIYYRRRQNGQEAQ